MAADGIYIWLWNNDMVSWLFIWFNGDITDITTPKMEMTHNTHRYRTKYEVDGDINQQK